MAKTVYINLYNDLFYEYASNRKSIFIQIPGHHNYYLRTKDISPFKQMLYRLYKKLNKLQNGENSFICKAYDQDIKVSVFNPNQKLFFYSRTAQISKKEIGFCILQNPPKMTYSLVGIYNKDKTEFNIYNTKILSKKRNIKNSEILIQSRKFYKLWGK